MANDKTKSRYSVMLVMGRSERTLCHVNELSAATTIVRRECELLGPHEGYDGTLVRWDDMTWNAYLVDHVDGCEYLLQPSGAWMAM